MKTLLTLGLAVGCIQLNAQNLQIDTSFNAETLTDRMLSGAGIRVGNVQHYGIKQSIGYFSTDTAMLDISSGILLSTGSVNYINRPNTTPGTSSVVWDSTRQKRYKSDRDLNKLCRSITCDHVILEFDFVPFHNHLTFRYVFASEEYCEYVGSRYNDVFGFFLSGPNMRQQNLALLPGTKMPVAINTVNHKQQKDLWISNDFFLNYAILKGGNAPPFSTSLKRWWNKIVNSKNHHKGYFVLPDVKASLNQTRVNGIEYDGMTHALEVHCIVEPGKRYHLKIAVGDVGDAYYDSGVMLEEGSFRSYRDTTVARYKPYPDISTTWNWDSIFGRKQIPPVPPPLPPIDEAFEITNIIFDFDHFDLTDTAVTQLNNLTGYLMKHPEFKLIISGYTDNKGSRSYNQNLSEKRAKEVMQYLSKHGIATKRMQYIGNNFENPIADNRTDEGRALNRRVELTIVDDEREQQEK